MQKRKHRDSSMQIYNLKSIDSTFSFLSGASFCVFATCFPLKDMLIGPLECAEAPKCLSVPNGCTDRLMDDKSQMLNAW